MSIPSASQINWVSSQPIATPNTYTKFFPRFGAFVIDCLVGLPIGFGAYMVLSVALGDVPTDDTVTGAFIAAPVFILKAWRQSTHGQSIGQSALKMSVVSVDGKNNFAAWVRNLLAFGLMAIPFLNAINVIVILVSKDKRGIHDRIAGTWIINYKLLDPK